MEVLVPFDAVEPKTRLASLLAADERRAFAEAMLSDVLTAIRTADHEPRVLTTERVPWVDRQTVDDRPLTDAVNAALADHTPTHDHPLVVVMADLPLVTPAVLTRLTTTDPPRLSTGSHTTDSTDETTPSVTIAPGLGGGTNALVVREPSFRVDYHGASCRDHERIARTAGATVRRVDSRRLATDVDEPDDLAELLLHADESSAARRWLTDAGFRLDTGDGRVTVERET